MARHSDSNYVSCAACGESSTQLRHWLDASRELRIQRDDLLEAAEVALPLLRNQTNPVPLAAIRELEAVLARVKEGDA